MRHETSCGQLTSNSGSHFRFTELRLASKLVTEATGAVVAVAKSSAVRAEGKLRCDEIRITRMGWCPRTGGGQRLMS